MLPKIRLLLVTDEMELGGTQRQIALIARLLDRERFTVSVLFFRNSSSLVDELRAQGIEVIEIHKRGRFDPLFALRLARFLAARQFEVMHCFAFGGELWGALGRRTIAARVRPALITSIRCAYEWYTPLHWRIKRWTYGQSAALIANSRGGANYACARMGLAPAAIEIVFNGVALANQQERKIAANDGAVVRALFVGRIVEQKNLPVLLRAMRRLREAGVPIELKIAGDGPLVAHCRELIEQFGLVQSVQMLGPRDDAPELMGDADFVVLPSLREGLSNVILEAMSAGRPVIASAIPGNDELVEPEATGLLFPSDDDEALAAAMIRLAGDAPLRTKMGAEARRRAEDRFSPEAMIRAMEQAYTRCAAQR